MATLIKQDGTEIESSTYFDLIQIITRGDHVMRLTVSERWPDGTIANEPDGGKPGSDVFEVPILDENGMPNSLLGKAMLEAAAGMGIDLSVLPPEAQGKMLLDAVRLAAVTVAKQKQYIAENANVETLLS